MNIGLQAITFGEGLCYISNMLKTKRVHESLRLLDLNQLEPARRSHTPRSLH